MTLLKLAHHLSGLTRRELVTVLAEAQAMGPAWGERDLLRASGRCAAECLGNFCMEPAGHGGNDPRPLWHRSVSGGAWLGLDCGDWEASL